MNTTDALASRGGFVVRCYNTVEYAVLVQCSTVPHYGLVTESIVS